MSSPIPRRPLLTANPDRLDEDAMHDTPVVLGDVIERNARYFPGKTAVIFEDRRVTFSQFAARVRRFANALAGRGLQRQARFAVLAQNCLEYFEAVGAAERAGFIAVTLNWRLSPRYRIDPRRLHADGVGFRGAVHLPGGKSAAARQQHRALHRHRARYRLGREL